MSLSPRSWRQPTVANDVVPAAPPRAPAPTALLPLDADLSALLAKDDTLLATIQEQCRARGLYLVHDGREIKVTPFVQPGWRVIVENDKNRTKAAA